MVLQSFNWSYENDVALLLQPATQKPNAFSSIPKNFSTKNQKTHTSAI